MSAFTPVIIILVCILGLLLLPVVLGCGLLVFFVGSLSLSKTQILSR
ncbi:hypothetical protein SAMN05720766_11068 [Fibrobacter sp. UWH9]|nr:MULTISPECIES: hypothetical protein [Fibrobacter]MCL4102499.1 hypothetical protein [Fibrobacter succinogenes]MCQ2101115.1 hypothetical protein [Fibrobacter sp.]SHH33344.1 hypothetical protein SAMN05720766_11068 [Fibrobacter sp. UWH9]SHL52670.1 hypothetical protein SAMN05720765_11659 [Fibrobacter sp. UWH6]